MSSTEIATGSAIASARISAQSLAPSSACERVADLGRIIGREREDLHVAVPVDAWLLGLGFFEDAVEIAAAEAECADRRAARVAGARQPGPRLGVQVERRVPAGEPLDRPADLGRRRQDLVMKRQRRLDQPRRSGGGLGVPHLRLDRSQGTPRASGPGALVDLLERRQLDRVADLGPGPVRLDQLDRRRARCPPARKPAAAPSTCPRRSARRPPAPCRRSSCPSSGSPHRSGRRRAARRPAASGP